MAINPISSFRIALVLFAVAVVTGTLLAAVVLIASGLSGAIVTLLEVPLWLGRLLTGLLFLLTIGLKLAIMRKQDRKKSMRLQALRDDLKRVFDIKTWIRSHPKTAVGAATVFGYAIGSGHLDKELKSAAHTSSQTARKMATSYLPSLTNTVIRRLVALVA